MCQAFVRYDCGHSTREKIHCDRSRNKPGLKNFLKYAAFEPPCQSDIPKRRHRMCRGCESHYEEIKAYKLNGGERTGANRDKRPHSDRSVSDRERTSDPSHSHRERRHRDDREHREKRSSEKSSSSRSDPRESHSSRSSSHRHKSSREGRRGRPTRARSPMMATIDESAPLPPQPVSPLAADDDFAGGMGDASPVKDHGPMVHENGSSINDFREFVRAAELAEEEQNRARGVIPDHQPVSPLVPQDPVRPPSSVYQPARANWEPRPKSAQQSNNHSWRPPSSVYSRPSYNAPLVPQNSIPQPSANFAGSDVSWYTDYVSSEAGTASSHAFALSSNNTSIEKDDKKTVHIDKAGTAPTQTFEPASYRDFYESPPRVVDAWTTDPYDRLCKQIGRQARVQLAGDESQPGNQSDGRLCSYETREIAGKARRLPRNHLQSELRLTRTPPRPGFGLNERGSPRAAQIPQTNLPKGPPYAGNPRIEGSKPQMMHFTCYRDPNNPKPPPAPTASAAGSQVYMNPRAAPAPPDPRGHLPIPSAGFNAHRLARDSVDNLSHVTRWSELCPQNVNTDIRGPSKKDITAVHNGKPVRVVNPRIVKNSWGDAKGPSAGKVSQRASANSQDKKLSSNSRLWFSLSRFRPQDSEVSFGCVDAAKHDSLNSQKRPDSKRSDSKRSKHKSGDSKSKER